MPAAAPPAWASTSAAFGRRARRERHLGEQRFCQRRRRHLFAAGRAVLRGNVIARNVTSGFSPCTSGGGIWMVNFSQATIVNNLVVGNVAGCGGGFYWGGSTGVTTFVNNTFADNDGAEGSAAAVRRRHYRCVCFRRVRRIGSLPDRVRGEQRSGRRRRLGDHRRLDAEPASGTRQQQNGPDLHHHDRVHGRSREPLDEDGDRHRPTQLAACIG